MYITSSQQLLLSAFLAVLSTIQLQTTHAPNMTQLMHATLMAALNLERLLLIDPKTLVS